MEQSSGIYITNRVNGTYAHIDSWPEFLEASDTESPYDDSNYFVFKIATRGLDGYTVSVAPANQSAPNQKIVSAGNGLYVYRLDPSSQNQNIMLITATDGTNTYYAGVAVLGTYSD